MNFHVLSCQSSGVQLCRDHPSYKVMRKPPTFKRHSLNIIESVLKNRFIAVMSQQHFSIYTRLHTVLVKSFKFSPSNLPIICPSVKPETSDPETVPKQMLTCKREGRAF